MYPLHPKSISPVVEANMSLHALIRTISAYDGPDLFLGLFSDVHKAECAREAYLKSVSLVDPWSKQSYRRVDLESDVRVVEVEDFREPTDSSVVFLVTAHFEAMGQIRRWFLGVFSERLAAVEFAAREEARPIDIAPSRCDVAEVVLDVAR